MKWCIGLLTLLASLSSFAATACNIHLKTSNQSKILNEKSLDQLRKHTLVKLIKKTGLNSVNLARADYVATLKFSDYYDPQDAKYIEVSSVITVTHKKTGKQLYWNLENTGFDLDEKKGLSPFKHSINLLMANNRFSCAYFQR